MSLKKNNFNRFVVFCNDAELFEYLSVLGFVNNLAMVPSIHIDSNKNLNFSKKFTITQAKAFVWYKMMEYGVDFMFSEPDVVN